MQTQMQTQTDIAALKFHVDNAIPKTNAYWVFGSNLAGRHGKGAARVAHDNFGAQYGVGEGPTGNSYAIPAKGRKMEILSLAVIESNVNRFLDHASVHPTRAYFVTRIGCGLAGYADEQIAPIFAARPLANLSYPDSWRAYMEPTNVLAFQSPAEVKAVVTPGVPSKRARPG